MALAVALLVFTGVWHLTEFLMDRESSDARKLIPFGMLYTGLGIVIALGIGGWMVGATAALAVLTGMVLAILNRKTLDVRRWVIWAYVIIDVAIVVSIIAHFV